MAYGDPQPTAPIVSGVQANGGLPPRMSLDAVAVLSGVTSAQLGGLNGPFDGAIVVTTGASSTGDGLGKAWVWVEGDTTTANGTTVLGTGPYGRWRDATALTGGGTGAGTSITLNPAAGQITDAGTVTASNVQLAITGARVYTGLLAATGGQLIKVITNTSAFAATFNHQDGTATAANRVITSSGAAFVLGAGKSATFVYDTTAQRWRIAGQDTAFADAAGTAQRAASLDNLTTEQLFALPAVTGQTVITTGRFAAGDGGGGEFVGNASSTATADGGRIGGTSGRWLSTRLPDVRAAEEYLGALDDTDKTARLALLWASTPPGGVVIFGGGDIRVTAQQVIPNGAMVVGTVKRADRTNATLSTARPTRWWWDSANTSTAMFRLTQFENLSGMHIFARPSRTLAAMALVAPRPGLNASSSSIAGTAGWGYGSFGNTTFCGTLTDGVVIGPGETTNCDYVSLRDVSVWNFERHGVHIAGGEPYQTELDRCIFSGIERGPLATPTPLVCYGRAIYLEASSSSLIAERCIFSRVEEIVYASGDFSYVRLDNCDNEYCKKIYASPGGFYAASGTVTIKGGTYKLHNHLVSKNYAADDYNVIDEVRGVSFEINAFVSGIESPYVKIRHSEHTNIDLKGYWSDRDPFRLAKVMGGGSEVKSGRVTASWTADAPTASVYVRRPARRDGCVNPDGYAVLTAGMDTVDVGFFPIEPVVPVVEWREEPLTGTPVAGTWAVSTTVNGLVAVRTPAVDTGSVTFRYKLRPADPEDESARASEAAFSADTVMGTALNAGMAGNAAGCWWSFEVHQWAQTSAGGNQCVAAHGASNNGWALLQIGSGGLTFSTNNGQSSTFGEGAITLPPSRTALVTPVYTGTNLVLYVDGVQVYSGAQSFTPQTTQRTIIGSCSQSAGAYYNRVASLRSCANGDGVPTAADVAAHFRESRRYGYVRPMGGSGVSTLHRYVFTGSGAANDLVGTANISLVSGTAPGKRAIKPSWRS